MTHRKMIEELKENREFSNPGDEYRTVYQLKYEDGEEKLVPVDMVNIQDSIQSHEASVNINNILARYSMGNEGVLNRVEGFYGEVGDMSRNFADYLNVDMKAKVLFDGLPAEIRELFGNDYRMLVLEPERIKELYKEEDVEAVKKEVGVEDDGQEH